MIDIDVVELLFHCEVLNKHATDLWSDGECHEQRVGFDVRSEKG